MSPDHALEQILEGEPPHDLYIHWKSLARQPLGWEPDLNDGVRLNIRPFMLKEGKRGVSLLRARPSIKWGIDRGKNPDGSERDNDLHYSLAEKRLAREHGDVDQSHDGVLTQSTLLGR